MCCTFSSLGQNCRQRVDRDFVFLFEPPMRVEKLAVLDEGPLARYFPALVDFKSPKGVRVTYPICHNKAIGT